ncbi:MAG: Fumarate hydratase class II [Parcubacteria group bacterium GW2011_GWA2_53_21]|nr:MAG: Fumarate hydratase class II [Parcubacteria group bacterium GW2011_GWA2_53_21]
MTNGKVLYQDETKKALENFIITGHPFSKRLAHRVALVKIAAAKANEATGVLPKNIADAICAAGEELLRHDYDEHIVVDRFQGGAGTSVNMNVNEVIATRATEIMGGETVVHPLDHVNRSQSTNDVIPTAMKIAALQLLDKLIGAYEQYALALKEKAREFEKIIKIGRTQLQDAVPMTLGQEFLAHAAAARADIERLKRAKPCLYELNLGGTAIGTGINATPEYQKFAIEYLARRTGYPLRPAADLIYATQYADSFMEVSALITVNATNLIKCMNDLRLLSSGPRTGFGEITFAAVQKGSSIMPGKVNPVLAETINQICFQIIGNNQTILMAVQAGQLELNVMLPVVAKNLFESLNALTNGLIAFTERALKTLTANPERCRGLLENSLALATALTPKLGYDQAATIVKQAMEENKTLRAILAEHNIMTTEEFDGLLNDDKLTRW